MKAILILVASCMMLFPIAWAEGMPDGKSVQVKENAMNVPVGRILLARRGKEYCAVRFLSSSWTRDESYAKYVAYYVPDPGTSFTDATVKPHEDEVYQKQPLRIIGRIATARSQDKIFCNKIILRWSGGPNETAWVYFDENRELALAPTKWRDIQSVSVTDVNLKWFQFGEVDTTVKVPD